MKSVILIGLAILEITIGFLLFKWQKNHIVVFKNIETLRFYREVDVLVPNSNSRNANGHWFLFNLSGQILAFEDKKIIPDHEYTVVRKMVHLDLIQENVSFCRDFNLLRFLATRIVIMFFPFILYLSCWGWLLQKLNIGEIYWLSLKVTCRKL